MRFSLENAVPTIRFPVIHRAFALSIVLHALALFWAWPSMVARLPLENPEQDKPPGALAARLAPEALPSVAPRASPVPPPPRMPQRAPRIPTPEPAAPAIATPPPPAEPANPTPAARPPILEDFAASVAARQRAREAAGVPAAAAPPSPTGRVETEQERHSREVAANLGLDRPATFGAERHPGGGMFQVQNLGSDEAELVFFGWNRDIRRNARQVLQVRRGNHPSIELALVRRMIAIIRDHESGDFIWESLRLGRHLTLSARLADNAGLEDVLMRDFFPDYASRR